MKNALICLNFVALACLVCGCSEDLTIQQQSGSQTAFTSEPKPTSTEPVFPKGQQATGSALSNQKVEKNWLRFRGPNGSGISQEKGLPTEWSETKNLVWKTKIPGSGSSSPIVVGNRIFVAYYNGYGLDKRNPGDVKNLERHLLCVNANNGQIIWDHSISKDRPIHSYTGFMHLHGYASSTPVSDGERVYVFFGAWGVTAFDLEGKKLWEADCGNRTHGFGSGASPILHEGLLIVNASIESTSLIAFNKRTGEEVWRAKNIRNAWNTPILVKSGGKMQVVLTTEPAIMAFDAANGRLLWQYNGAKQNTYVCPSLVTDGETIYGMPSYYGPVVAVRANGQETWKSNSRFRATVPSPVNYQGHIYYPQDEGNIACLDAKTGMMKKQVHHRTPKGTYASPLIADGKLFIVTRSHGTLVYSATPQLEQLAHNTFAGDDSRFHGSPVPLGSRLLLRSEKYLYCVGNLVQNLNNR